jgi:hypothetical protein
MSGATNTAREIYEHPANRFVAEFVGELNALPDGPANRPHHVHFGEGGLSGRVLACAFAGNMWRCRLQVGAGEWLVEAHPTAQVPAAGEVVGLHWSAEHVIAPREGDTK